MAKCLFPCACRTLWQSVQSRVPAGCRRTLWQSALVPCACKMLQDIMAKCLVPCACRTLQDSMAKCLVSCTCRTLQDNMAKYLVPCARKTPQGNLLDFWFSVHSLVLKVLQKECFQQKQQNLPAGHFIKRNGSSSCKVFADKGKWLRFCRVSVYLKERDSDGPWCDRIATRSVCIAKKAQLQHQYAGLVHKVLDNTSRS